MKQTKLQKTSDKQCPCVYYDKPLIENGFVWKKEQLLDIDYDVPNKHIIIAETFNGME